MAKKFIPNGDTDFLMMARKFANPIVTDAARFEVGAEDAAALGAAVARFDSAFMVCRHGGGVRSSAATREKDEARAEAERIIRRLAHVVRASERINDATKIMLGIQPRKRTPTALSCPQEPPRLEFKRALHERAATPVHELSFSTMDFSKTKPAGAVRLELFVDFVPPDDAIPTHPEANPTPRLRYLRSYTRSPIRLVPPMPSAAMRIVYWGRWADSLGNFGPYSATAIGWIEGGSHPLLPGGVGMSAPAAGRPAPRVIDVATPVPALRGRDERYVVAMLAEVRAMQQQGSDEAAAELPAPREPRRIEGPARDDEREETAAAA